MRILWVSDAPWHTTGYGVTTRYICDRLAQDGHEVYCYAPGAAHHGVIDYQGYTVLTADFGDDRWGNKTIHHLVQEFRPDVIITWLDCQGLIQYAWSEIPVYMWAPIDTWPIPNTEVAILNRARKVIAPSQWGIKILEESGIKGEYIPCGINLQTYDVSTEGRKRWRNQIRPAIDDDTFLIGMVGLNSGSPDRKGYGFAFDAIRVFAEKHKDVRVHIHTNIHGDGMAIDLEDLRADFGLQNVVSFSRPQLSVGVTSLYMRDMYNAFDVLFHCGMCEGFGMPLIEAQACGTPVVFNSCTSMTELVEDGYPAEPLTDMVVSTVTRIALPSVPNLLEQLEQAYQDWYHRRNLGCDASPEVFAEVQEANEHLHRTHVRESVQRFEESRIYDEMWRPLLAQTPVRFNPESAGPRKLMLAAGALKKEGFVHHDKEILFDHHEVAHDLNVFPWPWKDNSWDYIEFSDCLEHLKTDFIGVMDELWRICAPSGHVYIHTAESGTWQLMKDPTHVQGFDIDAMDYLDPEMKHGYIYSYSSRKWKVELKTRDDGGLLFILQPRKAEEAMAEAAS